MCVLCVKRDVSLLGLVWFGLVWFGLLKLCVCENCRSRPRWGDLFG